MEHSMDMAGRTAVVTGAGGGIGAAVAIELARRGAALVVADLPRSPGLPLLHEELTRLGATARVAEIDAVDAAQVRALFSDDGLGADVDILVNGAGVLFGTPSRDVSESEWDLVVDVNLKASFLMAQAALERMRVRGWGRVVNVSSTAGKNVSTIGGVHYTAAKAGVLGLTRHLAHEYAAHGITVNAVCPGLIDTPMVHTTIEPAQVRRYAESFPVQRLGTPEEVAAMICYLVSDDAAYVTGASLDINGGDLMT